MDQPRKKVGLALGGGVARGLAHIGVLKILVESGIPVDYVAGTSAGSIIGATFCAGMSLEQVKEIGLKMRWWHMARPVWPARGLVSFQPLADWLARLLGDPQIEDLPLPYAALATDLKTGQPVVLNTGRLATAVQASCAVPGLVEPVEMDGRLLGDGSLTNTVPVDVLRRMGADYVIGVDIFKSAIRKRWGVFGLGFNALEILIERAGGGIETADCLIVPPLGGKTYLRFSRREEFFLLGEQAALEQIDRIRAAIAEPAGIGRALPVN